MSHRTLLAAFATALLAGACSGPKASTKAAEPVGLEPSSRCYEGALRIFGDDGSIRENTPVVARYVVEPGQVAVEEVELGQPLSRSVYGIAGGQAKIEVDDTVLSGPVATTQREVVVEVASGPGPMSLASRLVLSDESAREHLAVESEGGSGHMVRVLVRIDDSQCDARMKLYEQSGRTTLARPARELIEAARENEGGGKVSLTYAWPTDLEGRVWADSVLARNGEEYRGRTPFTLGTEAHADGMVLRVESSFAEAVGDVSERLEKVLRVSDFLIYPSVISSDGVVASIHDYEEVASMVQAMVGSSSAAAAGMWSEEAMKAEVRKTWGALVAAWKGAELEIGKAYIRRTKMPQVLPTGVQAVVEAETEYTVWGWVPCRPGGDAADCVVVQMSQKTDPDYVREALRPFFEERGEEMPELQQYEQLFSTITVLDPETLVPFEYHEVNVANVTIVAEGAEPARSEKVDQKVLTFHYE